MIMNQPVGYQVSDLETFTTDREYALSDDVPGLAVEIERKLLEASPGLNHQGLVIVFTRVDGTPTYFKPLGIVH